MDSPYVRYENEKIGIAIEYCAAWDTRESSEYPTVRFISPGGGWPSVYRPNFLVSAVLLSEYKGNTLEEVANEDFQGEQSAHDVTIIENFREITLDHNSALRILYSYYQKEVGDFTTLEIWSIRNDIVYSLAYYSQTEKYSEFLPVIQKMIDSFTVIKTGLDQAFKKSHFNRSKLRALS